MKRFLYLGLLSFCMQFVLSAYTFAQESKEKVARDCTEPTEIVINRAGLNLVSSGEYESYGFGETPILFYKPSDKYTFWYKFIVQESCSFSFQIYPSSPSDIYNFFLYKYPGGSFCKGIIDRSIIPIRANLYKSKIHATGTGLKKNMDAPGSFGEKNVKEKLYDESYHQTVNALAGDIYYLNVYHTSGDDCGHQILITACAQELEIQVTHKPCFIPPKAASNTEKNLQYIETIAALEIATFTYEAEIEINETSAMEASIVAVKEFALQANEVSLAKPDISKMAFSVVAGAISNGVNSDIKVIDKKTGQTTRYKIDANEETIHILLDQSRNYEVLVSSLGYVDQILEIEAGQDFDENMTVKLEHVSAGASLVLNDLLFHPNTFALRDASYDEVQNLLSFMQANESAKIKLIGYTSGDYRIRNMKRYEHLGPKWNFQGSSKKLSRLRAAEIQEYLFEQGVSKERIEIEGRGGKNMIIAHPLSNQESLINMRVEMLILDI